MPINVPNLLTWLRILMIPLLVGVYYMPPDWIAEHNKNLAAMSVFSFAAITDLLDGYLARALNQTSPFGAFLDPVADKLMVTTALIMLLYHDELLTLSMHAIGTILIYVAAVLTLWSMVYYLRMALPQAMNSS